MSQEVQAEEFLGYAPIAKDPKRKVWVVAAGLLTTAITLALVYFINHTYDNYVMGYYVNGILPAGALLVGLGATTGYGLASYGLGVKIQKWLLVTILGLQCVGYVAAQYVEYLAQGPLYYATTKARVGFTDYFHDQTVNMVFKRQRPGAAARTEEPQPLGNLGYLVRFGELAGFVLGSLVAPMALRRTPYCELCERYMKKKLVARWAAKDTSIRLLPKFGKAAQEAKDREAEIKEAGLEGMQALCAAGEAGDVETYQAQAKALGRKKAGASERFEVTLVHCTNCASGYLKNTLTVRRGRAEHTTQLGQAHLTPEFVRQVR
jgi:hypothetical protein